ncbi:MAG: MotA/TolQ/ExbB proton channel family protein [Rhodobacteraceae bacterium]|nr:MotA/TolQ/ExbB proton channel family protein [Paracoccaceae bacterium]
MTPPDLLAAMIPGPMLTFLARGGPALWLIAALSVLTLALILWKTWRLARLGAWSGAVTRRAVAAWEAGDAEAARAALAGRRALRARLAHTAMAARLDPTLDDAAAREETARRAKADLAQARAGLRALELIATIAPLLGLLGTVLGMIEAFQALQEAGNRADPAALAGGIWEALLTTAAGMAVAIPASAALSWFDAVTARVQADMEDLATRIFIRGGRR